MYPDLGHSQVSQDACCKTDGLIDGEVFDSLGMMHVDRLVFGLTVDVASFSVSMRECSLIYSSKAPAFDPCT
jgi:hypothetical protein